MTTRVKLLLTPILDIDTVAIRNRLTKHLETLRARKLAEDLIGDDDRTEEFGVEDVGSFAAELSEGNELTYLDKRRIETRAKALVEARKRSMGLGHLKEEERNAVMGLTPMCSPSPSLPNTAPTRLRRRSMQKCLGWRARRSMLGTPCAGRGVAANQR